MDLVPTLITGAFGIGSHSLSLLLSVLSETTQFLPACPLQTALPSITAAAHNVSGLGLIVAHCHAHGHGHVLDSNATWSAAASIVSKEWLIRITCKVADQENRVMLIRAWPHWSRFSEAVGSLRCHWTLSEVSISSLSTSFFALFCSWIVFWLLLSSSNEVSQYSRVHEMTDASVPEPVLPPLSSSLEKVREDPRLESFFLHVCGIRA
jgi:hypothetical protein